MVPPTYTSRRVFPEVRERKPMHPEKPGRKKVNTDRVQGGWKD